MCLKNSAEPTCFCWCFYITESFYLMRMQLRKSLLLLSKVQMHGLSIQRRGLREKMSKGIGTIKGMFAEHQFLVALWYVKLTMRDAFERQVMSSYWNSRSKGPLCPWDCKTKKRNSLRYIQQHGIRSDALWHRKHWGSIPLSLWMVPMLAAVTDRTWRFSFSHFILTASGLTEKLQI